MLRNISALFNNAPDLLGALKKTIEENADLRREAEQHMAERTEALARELLEKATITNSGIRLVTLRGARLPEIVKNLAFKIREHSPEATAFVSATTDITGKPLLTVMVTNDLSTTHNASTIVREAAKAIKGGGGGQPGFAQAGGKDAEGLEKAFNTLVANF